MIPVVWLGWPAEGKTIARGYWDQGMLELLLEQFPVEHLDEIPTSGGAIVVVPGRYHADDVERLNEALAALSWCVVIVVGDEESRFPWRDLRHPNLRLWVMAPRPEHVVDGVFYIGSGYKADTPAILARESALSILGDHDRPVDVMFAGQVTHLRRRQLATALAGLEDSARTLDVTETPGFTQGLDRDEYLRRLTLAKVAPCPSGPATVDSFRLFEALEAGCVPIADGRTPAEGMREFWPAIFGGWPPFPIVEEWDTLPTVVDEILADWPRVANRVFAWWQGQKRRMARRLIDDVAAVSGLDLDPEPITVLVPTSVIPAHPDLGPIVETLGSIRAQLPTAEVLVMIDGVRPEQADRKAAFDEYVRRLLWLTNATPGVSPLMFDSFQHQANMTRRGLAEVHTPLVMFVEHDTPLCGEIPWDVVVDVLTAGHLDVVRFHFEAGIPEPHRHLMLDPEPVTLGALPVIRTAQWSQRPHVATTAYYREILDRWFPTTGRTMIEDKMHSVCEVEWRRHGVTGWARNRVGIYAPDGSFVRSRNLDGRGADPKYEMRFE